MQDSVVLVTGSGHGIGRAIATRLAQEGARIIIHDRHDNRHVRETLDNVQEAGGQGCIVTGDISLPDVCRGVIVQGVGHMGRIDVLVNNAGVEGSATFLDVTEDEFDAVLNVNFKGAFFAAQALSQHLHYVKQKGRIINVSSFAEEFSGARGDFRTSGGSMKRLLRDLAIELAPLGITVNNVLAGAVAAPIAERLPGPEPLASLIDDIPLGRLGVPLDIANAVLFLASPDADYITGTTLYVDGGLSWKYRQKWRR